MEEKLIKKVDELIKELADLGDLVLRLKEENKIIQQKLEKKEEIIERLIKEREELKKRISSLIEKIKELEERIVKGDYV